MLPYNQKELLGRIAAGDERAFSLFYRHTNAQLYQAAMIYLKNEHTAREIVQIVYIKLWDHRHTLMELSRLDDYLFILTRNAVFDHFKKITVETKLLAGLYGQASETRDNVTVRMQERECGRLLQRVLKQLPARQRQVYMLADEYEMSYDEIAARLQLSKFTVKRHLEMARRYVRNYIHQHLHHMTTIPLFFLATSSLMLV